MPNPGDNLRDRYVLKREIGRGGMAEVHLAFDSYLQREVAIKFTRLELFDDAEIGSRARKLWLNETRLAGRLQHPHIVQTYEAGESDGFAYLVMEYVDGESLQRHASADNLLPVERVADILFKVATALDYAAKLGMLHRDIKPANVLLTRMGSVKLMDFGACYFTNVEDTQVYDVGTLPFMPPEHFENRPPTVQTDIYALGVMAYQLLTGLLPFRGETFQSLIHEKLHADYVPLETRRKDLPGQLRFVVHRAMQRDMETRYASWRDFCDELAHALPQGDRPAEVMYESARFTSLRAMPLFSQFTESELWEVVHLSRWTEMPAGKQIFSAGDPGDRICVLVSGAVEISAAGRMLSAIAPGECFGEIAFLDEAAPRRTAAATAAEPGVLIEIDTDALRNASSALQAAFLKAFVRVMIARIKQADARFLAVLEVKA